MSKLARRLVSLNPVLDGVGGMICVPMHGMKTSVLVSRGLSEGYGGGGRGDRWWPAGMHMSCRWCRNNGCACLGSLCGRFTSS